MFLASVLSQSPEAFGEGTSDFINGTMGNKHTKHSGSQRKGEKRALALVYMRTHPTLHCGYRHSSWGNI